MGNGVRNRVECGTPNTLQLSIIELALTKEPSQINVILQQKMLAAKMSAVCTVYKQ